MEMHDLPSFGELVRTWRKRHHLKQQIIAAKLGVHLNTISKWERGICLPASKGLVLELAYHLGLTAPETRQLLHASLVALPSLQHALARREQALGPDHPDVAASLKRLALLYHAQGQDQEALLLMRRALAIWEQTWGSDHPIVVTGSELVTELGRALDQSDQIPRRVENAHLEGESDRVSSHQSQPNPLDKERSTTP